MEEEIWKCQKHPSNRGRNGICPTCLYDRLVLLCTDCAKVRPCACCAPGDRVSNLIENEPSFRRSRSLAVPFLRPKLAAPTASDRKTFPKLAAPTASDRKTLSFWSVFKASKGKKGGEENTSGEFIRSKSVSLAVVNGKRWHFPSPMKAFRQSRVSNGLHQRSPLYR